MAPLIKAPNGDVYDLVDSVASGLSRSEGWSLVTEEAESDGQPEGQPETEQPEGEQETEQVDETEQPEGEQETEQVDETEQPEGEQEPVPKAPARRTKK